LKNLPIEIESVKNKEGKVVTMILNERGNKQSQKDTIIIQVLSQPATDIGWGTFTILMGLVVTVQIKSI